MGTIAGHLHRMKWLVLLLAVVPYIQSLCVLNQCSSWWAANKNNVTGVCAVLFDENCCDTGDTSFAIKRGEKGKLCSGGSSLNPFSSCKGPRLDNDVESMIVMPGCKLEVWDDEDGVSDAEDEERKSFNEGNNVDPWARRRVSAESAPESVVRGPVGPWTRRRVS